MFLSYAEHVRAVRPSLILSTYLFVSLLLDAARARTLWLEPGGLATAAVFTAGLAVKFVNLVLEATEKRWILRPQYAAYPPEATSGIFNRCFFWWQNSLFRKGFSNTLVIDDLFVLDKHLNAEYLQVFLQSAWAKGLSTFGESGPEREEFDG